MEHYLLGLYGIDTKDPDCVDAVLNTRFTDFALGDRQRAFEPLLGDGIFTQDGAAWKKSRDMLRPQFMQTRTKSFPFIQQEVEGLIETLSQVVRKDASIDLQPMFFQLTLDTTLAVLCGRSSINSMTTEHASGFTEAFEYAQSRLMLRSRLGPFYWLANNRRFRESCEIVRSFAEQVVQEALQKHAEYSTNDTSDRYIFLHDLIKTNQDPVVLRDQLINILLAGRDTTACLLSWVFKFLARHQDIQEELRNASLDLESHRAGNLPTVGEIKSMKLLENVLHESLRLYPSVPINIREAVKDTELPRGGGLNNQSPIFIRKGQAVGYSLYSMHRLERFWGADNETFRPSRWEEASIKDCRKAYAPFNAGPRLCPGQEFALLEAGYTVVRILQTFDYMKELENEPKEFKHSITLVVAPQNGCKVRLGTGKSF